MRRHALVLAALAVLLSVSCGGGGRDGNPTGPQEPAEPSVPTAKGTPNGNASSKTIGPEGGSLVSADGRLTLTVPAGAVTGSIEFGIQPVTNQAYHAIGQAYQLTPEGQTFDEPVRLTLHYQDDELGETPADGLGIAYQDADGRWWGILETSVDTSQHTLTVSTAHFSAYTATTFWRFAPLEASVRANGVVHLSVIACYLDYSTDDEELAALVPTEECSPSIRTGRWTVNGVEGGNSTVGTVAAGSPTSQAVYTAPARRPNPTTVTVTGLLTWEARHVTKRFDARITVIGDTVTVHVTGVFDTGAFPGGQTAVSANGGMAHVTDTFEADVLLNEAQGGGSVASLSNESSAVGSISPPPDPAGIYCNFTVDGSYEHITVTASEVFFNPVFDSGRADATVRFTGLTQYPGGLLGSITDDGCKSLTYPGGSFDNQADLNFDRNRLTEPGQSISVSDASGWTFTVQWVE